MDTAAAEHPAHIENFVSNMKEVDRLLEIHSQITTPGPGRKYAVEVLHKSGIVLLVACWEAFIEDLAGSALQLLVNGADDHSLFPDDVLERVANKHQGKKAWQLAGTGWKLALNGHFKEVLAKTTGTLNTPKTEQVDELFAKVIGIPKLSSKWAWTGRPSVRSTKDLDALVALRGSIAHRVEASRNVRKTTLRNARALLVARLAVKSHNSVNAYLAAKVGTKPWDDYRFGETG